MGKERKVAELPYAYDKPKGISKEVMTWHHDKHYAGYVNTYNKIQNDVKAADKSAANANWSVFGDLKRRETFNANGAILHKIFFNIMGGDGTVDEELDIVQQIKKDFGSFDAFKEEFVATAKSALGWAVLAWDFSTDELHIYLVDFHNYGAVFSTMPLVPLDVWEHAYYRDYGPDRAAYIDAFLKNVDWAKVNASFVKNVPKEKR